MTDINAIASVSPNLAVHPAQTSAASPAQDFSALLTNGLHSVEARLNQADHLAQAFAIDDSIPVHQVTIALEQARLSLELALQVRTRLVDAFHEIMNMQL